MATCPAATGFGDAVRSALDVGHGLDVAPDWVWLLHDDCVPDADALEQLLAEVARDESVAVAGPKLRATQADRNLLLEVGVTIARSGRRETMLERREQDQGQHDGVHRVLAVSTAGMLVRRDVWDELGGLDPALPLLRDDVDLGWRANLAGHRVVCVTAAVVHHAEAATRRRRPVARRRPPAAPAGPPARAVRPAREPAAAAPARRAGVPDRRPRCCACWATWPRKLPRHAADELAALVAVLGRPDRLLRARLRRRRTRKVPARTAVRLLAPRSAGTRHLMETVALVAGSSSGESGAGRHRGSPARGTPAPSTGPTSEEDENLPSWSTSLLRRLLLRPSVGLVLALALLALLADRGLLGDGRLMGGALLPAPGSPADLWRGYVSAWHPVGVGSDAVAPPYLAVLAALASVLGGAERAVDLLLLAAVPLAGAQRLPGRTPGR